MATSAVRYYERRGLLEPDARTGANYRVYGPGAAERLRFIRPAQAAGFSLGDIRDMLALTGSDAMPCEDVRALIDRRLADVRRRLAELRQVEQALATARVTCCRQAPDWCGEILRLRRHPGPSPRPGRRTRR